MRRRRHEGQDSSRGSTGGDQDHGVDVDPEHTSIRQWRRVSWRDRRNGQPVRTCVTSICQIYFSLFSYFVL
eukprot:CCRYP_004890-RA/>CCRYP_004890-RA protein AED:0.34 eAED:1.00 QI:0/-1/0/1/-1/0/1/0/70